MERGSELTTSSSSASPTPGAGSTPLTSFRETGPEEEIDHAVVLWWTGSEREREREMHVAVRDFTFLSGRGRGEKRKTTGFTAHKQKESQMPHCFPNFILSGPFRRRT